MTTTPVVQVLESVDLLEEILIHLPVKSVTRLKLVSKQWLSQISNPEFVWYYSQHRPNRLHTGMFIADPNSDYGNADFVAFSDLDPTHQSIPSLRFLYDGIKHPDGVNWIKIVNSCNGLLLCIVYWCSFPSLSANYCVCNPTTKTFTLLMLPTGPVRPSPIYTAYLAFDSRHYKVVICDLKGKLYMYSSEDQSWKTFEFPSDLPWQGFFVNRAIYWLSPNSRYFSFCFDVYDEEMKLVQVPPKTSPCEWSSLEVVGGRLYYLEKNSDLRPNFRLREMTRDFSKWVTKYEASVYPLTSEYPQIAPLFRWNEQDAMRYCFSGICVVEGEKEGESQLVLGIPEKVILYSLKDKTAKELYTLQGPLAERLGYRQVQAFQFVESLFRV